MDDSYRGDPPEQHWENPYRDGRGLAFCGHCGDDWPCAGSQILDGRVEVTVILSSPEVAEIDPRIREIHDKLMEEFGPSRPGPACGGGRPD